jgi:hypothetical protein
MSKAFEEVCVALRIGHDESHEREVVAEMIIDLARTGVRDAKRTSRSGYTKVLIEGSRPVVSIDGSGRANDDLVWGRAQAV